MKAKKGISLIVLVITIIVIIILAAAVLLSLSKNNPMDNARTATYENDKAEVRSAVALYISNFVAKDYYHNGPFDTSGSVTSIDVGIKDGTDVKTGLGNQVVPSTGTEEDNGQVKTVSYNTSVTWDQLGLIGSSKPTSIYSCTYNPATGEFSFTAAAGYEAKTE